MIDVVEKLHDFLNDQKIKFKKVGISNIFQNYSFHYIPNIPDISAIKENKKQMLDKNIKVSEIIIFDQIERFHNDPNKYLIIGFEQSLIIHQYSSSTDSSYPFIHYLLSFNPSISVYFLSDTKKIINKIFTNEYHEIESIDKLDDEIDSLNRYFTDFNTENQIHHIWPLIVSCITGYLLLKSHLKLNKNRIEQFFQDIDNDKKSNPEVINENEYVVLRNVGSGSLFRCELAYHINRGDLYVIKVPNVQDGEISKLIDRERDNYTKIRYPFLPKFIGIVKDKDNIIIEYIKGQTLRDISKMNLTMDDKLKIIFELMLTLEYFHNKKMIYRDLRPDNVMIDDNKTAILIDFDRLIENDSKSERTLDLILPVPEYKESSILTYESDIYLLGKLIEYIMANNKLDQLEEQSIIEEIIRKCTNEKMENRPSISVLIQYFTTKFHSKITPNHLLLAFEYFTFQNDIKVKFNLDSIYNKGKYDTCNFDKVISYYSLAANQNYSRAQLNLGAIYYEGKYVKHDIIKSIHYYSLAANQNIPQAQFNLGVIYHEGKYITRDNSKAIHYFLLAANQNYPEAQFALGAIYDEGKYVTRDIGKAIHYYSLAADQNYPRAQFNLGVIYSEGKYVKTDINKAIYYFSLAANQNYPIAQFYLGAIYYEGKYITRDISKAIHYYSLAADQNYTEAQFNLGIIYSDGKYVKTDINQAIHYFSLAANQNYSTAQNKLGLIYSDGKYIERNINKAIHYFSLAANQNDPQAQCNLGVIYSDGKCITRDMNKAIHYFSLAANQNYPRAQFYLGFIYYEGKYVTQDISKTIHYYSLAANLNFPQAQFYLGIIYHEGKYIKHDINKAIHYFSLAANQNLPQAQFNIGVIYSDGNYVTRDINKAIHYFSLAANLNHPEAQFNLGVIYSDGKYVTRDINKAIYYYSLAANQNYSQAQLNLGTIYFEGIYVARDINTAIHYLSLAADQNNTRAQFNLGFIYNEGKYIKHDINKAIHYYSLAANQNLPQAQFYLGVIYDEGKYVTRDINKAIHYYSLAANQNYPQAQLNIGAIYSEGEYVTRDINKAIYYYSFAANQNLPQAQFNLGFIYYNGEYVTRNIDKAIHYFSLAANQNLPQAQFHLGLIYYEGKYVTRNIDKAINYLSLAANQNYPQAQHNLGVIYSDGKYVTLDINKTIHYFSLAANQNYSQAQLNLGTIYYDLNTKQSIQKGGYYIMLASKNGNRMANFAHGFLLQEGKVVKRNIEEAIHYYKEASSFNIQYAKNNLGIIYKHGYDNVKGRLGNAIVYFEEAIRQKNDYLSMYNLAHIYIYDETIKGDFNKSIELLIKSSTQFIYSFRLLTIALIKQFGFDNDIIKEYVEKRIKDIIEESSKYLELFRDTDLNSKIVHFVTDTISFGKSFFERIYEIYRSIDFVYNILFEPVLSSDLENKTVDRPKYPKAKDITSEFYYGFGRDLL